MTARKAPEDLVRKVPNPPKAKLKRGQPTSYHPDLDVLVYKFCLLGLTDEEIAHQLEVNPRTLYTWDKAHPTFYQARLDGRDKADAEVAESLRKMSTGFEHKGVYYPPQAKAAVLWLANRNRNRWKLSPGREDANEQPSITIKIVGGLPDE